MSHAWRGGCQAALLAQQSHLLQAALGTWVLNWEASVGHGATSQAGSCVPAQFLPPLSNGFEQICSLAARGTQQPSPCVSLPTCQGSDPQRRRAMGLLRLRDPTPAQLHESGPRASQFSSTLWIFVLSPAAFAAFAFIITCTSSSALSCSK